MYDEEPCLKEEGPQEQSEVVSIINQCHKLISEIESKSSLILLDSTPQENGKESGNRTLLEKELKGLLSHLRELSQRYKV